MSIKEDHAALDVAAWCAEHAIRTVVVAGVDTSGVLRGKRLSVEQFRSTVEHGMPLCDVFWVLLPDEETLVLRPEGHRGYFPNKAQGYPDITAAPDLSTLRVVPWHEATAIALATFCDREGNELPVDPRALLGRVVDRAQRLGYTPMIGIELEFYVLRETPRTLAEKGYTKLEPLNGRPYLYGVYGGSLSEPLIGRLREQLALHGIPMEGGNPEVGPGQFELNVRYAEALVAADNTALFKNAIKEIVAQEGMLATFMAKPAAAWPGNSCHLHFSLWRDDANAFWDDAGSGPSSTARHFVGGMLSTMVQLTALVAPTVNSYKRFVPYSWAATTATWGPDNRSTGLRSILEGPHGTRIEHRQAGGDANPYLAAAAGLAAGLHGVEHELEPAAAIESDAYVLGPAEAPRLPRSLGEALDLLEQSEPARELLGDEFVDYYVVYKRAELDAANAAVTDWEVQRYLEML